ncbi:MAG: murein hydrolase activator EnvC [Deltaproteobacteria bacterium]
MTRVRGSVRSSGPPGRRGRCVLWMAVLLVLLGTSVPGRGEDSYRELRREKDRLTRIRERAEKTAEELAETLRKERSTKSRVRALQSRLARQRRLIDRVDRKLAALNDRLERMESEVRSIESERIRSARGLEGAASAAFAAMHDDPLSWIGGGRRERDHRFTRRVLDAEAGRLDRLTEEKDRKERVLLGLERAVKASERKITEEKKAGQRLLEQRRAEARRLEDLRAEKERKEKELRALRQRIARMESLVSRIEKRLRDEERRAKRKPGSAGPSRFSALPGGILPPVRGTVISRFGKQNDPLFDVEVENRGVEIEAPSGSPVRSIGMGKVVFRGSVAGFGNVLILQHGSGLFSVYGRAESFSARQDQEVVAGQVIGRLPVNPDGTSVLYLELRAGGTAIDPLTVVPLDRR